MHKCSYFLFALLIFSMTFALACSDDDNGDRQQQGSESNICGDIDAVESAATAVGNLSTSSSLEDIRATLTSLRTAGQDLKSSLQDARSDDHSVLQQSVDDLQSTLTSAFSSGSLTQAQAELQSGANKVKQDVAKAKSDASCGRLTPTAGN